MDPLWHVLILLALLLANSLFAMSEIAVVSARKARLQQLANEGSRQAQAALTLAGSPLSFLASTQVGITIVAIVSGAFGEGALTKDLQGWFQQLHWLGDWADTAARVVALGGISYLSLVIGELVPKRLGLHYAERIACVVAGPMQWLANCTRPLVSLLAASTNLVVRLLGVRAQSDSPVTEEEIQVLIGQAAEAGVFSAAEEDLLQSAVRLSDRAVETLMTPRTEVVWIDLEAPVAGQIATLTSSHHGRFPIARGSLDGIAGIVEAREILAQTLGGGALDLLALRHDPVVVPEGTRVQKLLDIFREERSHLAVVVDEYGGVAGVVTLDDVLEKLLGEIPHHGEPLEESAVKRPDGSWLIDGLLPVADFKALLDLAELPAEDEYVTVAGFFLHRLGRLPRVADQVEYEGYSFEVVDMDGRRIDRLLVTPPAPPAAP
ncbi:MAG: HlyC/CorC family transporter [Fimbriimonadaceae bacterium]|nr:HlyC/CorC family transporter [Fimbriimonadaceae bacterium]